MNNNNYVPIFKYPGGNAVLPSSLPSNTVYKYITSLGGNKLNGPMTAGTLRPDGIPFHGGVVTTSNGISTVEYHHAIKFKK